MNEWSSNFHPLIKLINKTAVQLTLATDCCLKPRALTLSFLQELLCWFYFLLLWTCQLDSVCSSKLHLLVSETSVSQRMKMVCSRSQWLVSGGTWTMRASPCAIHKSSFLKTVRGQKYSLNWLILILNEENKQEIQMWDSTGGWGDFQVKVGVQQKKEIARVGSKTIWNIKLFWPLRRFVPICKLGSENLS